MRLAFLMLLLLAGAARADAPWVGAASKGCFDQWREAAVKAMNDYDGGEEFDDRKPWRIDRFGRLRARTDTSADTPENYGRYNDPYSFMWDYYGHTLVGPDGHWLMPEMDKAGVPPLREFVRQCEAKAPAEAQPETRTWFAPEMRDHRVDWCLHWGAACGEPAAQHFCHEQGYAEASLWEIEFNTADKQNPTYIMGDDRLCYMHACDGFKYISCRNRPEATGPAEPEVGYARFGADYRVFTPTPPTRDACAAACQAEDRCKAWSFNEAIGKCRLKHSVNPLTPAPGYTSGVKQKPPE